MRSGRSSEICSTTTHSPNACSPRLDLHPPLAFLAPAQATATPQAEPEVSLSEPVAASSSPQTDQVEAAAVTRRPRVAQPRRAPSIKTRTKPKKRR